MGRRAFSLLEVMVAVAILGLSLTTILSAQADTFASTWRAQRESQALGLARCKMTEIEERLLRLGYPEVDSNDEGPCCQDAQGVENWECTWKVQRILLPQPPTFAAVNPAGSGSAMNLLGTPQMMPTGGGPMPGMPPGMPPGLGALGPQMFGQGGDAGPDLASGDGGLSSITSMLGGANVSGMFAMVMTIVYPSLKPMLEASIRKITMTIAWHEGLTKRDLALVYYVTNPTRGNIMGTGPDGGPATGPASTGGGVTPQSGGGIVSPVMQTGGVR